MRISSFLHAGEQGAEFSVREVAGAADRFFNPLDQWRAFSHPRI